jgi:hypothetical protein
VLLHKQADAGFATAAAEVAGNVDGSQVAGDFTEQDGAVAGITPLPS